MLNPSAGEYRPAARQRPEMARGMTDNLGPTSQSRYVPPNGVGGPSYPSYSRPYPSAYSTTATSAGYRPSTSAGYRSTPTPPTSAGYRPTSTTHHGYQPTGYPAHAHYHQAIPAHQDLRQDLGRLQNPYGFGGVPSGPGYAYPPMVQQGAYPPNRPPPYYGSTGRPESYLGKGLFGAKPPLSPIPDNLFKLELEGDSGGKVTREPPPSAAQVGSDAMSMLYRQLGEPDPRQQAPSDRPHEDIPSARGVHITALSREMSTPQPSLPPQERDGGHTVVRGVGTEADYQKVKSELQNRQQYQEFQSSPPQHYTSDDFHREAAEAEIQRYKAEKAREEAERKSTVKAITTVFDQLNLPESAAPEPSSEPVGDLLFKSTPTVVQTIQTQLSGSNVLAPVKVNLQQSFQKPATPFSGGSTGTKPFKPTFNVRMPEELEKHLVVRDTPVGSAIVMIQEMNVRLKHEVNEDGVFDRTGTYNTTAGPVTRQEMSLLRLFLIKEVDDMILPQVVLGNNWSQLWNLVQQLQPELMGTRYEANSGSYQAKAIAEHLQYPFDETGRGVNQDSRVTALLEFIHAEFNHLPSPLGQVLEIYQKKSMELWAIHGGQIIVDRHERARAREVRDNCRKSFIEHVVNQIVQRSLPNRLFEILQKQPQRSASDPLPSLTGSLTDGERARMVKITGTADVTLTSQQQEQINEARQANLELSNVVNALRQDLDQYADQAVDAELEMDKLNALLEESRQLNASQEPPDDQHIQDLNETIQTLKSKVTELSANDCEALHEIEVGKFHQCMKQFERIKIHENGQRNKAIEIREIVTKLEADLASSDFDRTDISGETSEGRLTRLLQEAKTTDITQDSNDPRQSNIAHYKAQAKLIDSERGPEADRQMREAIKDTYNVVILTPHHSRDLASITGSKTRWVKNLTSKANSQVHQDLTAHLDILLINHGSEFLEAWPALHLMKGNTGRVILPRSDNLSKQVLDGSRLVDSIMVNYPNCHSGWQSSSSRLYSYLIKMDQEAVRMTWLSTVLHWPGSSTAKYTMMSAVNDGTSTYAWYFGRHNQHTMEDQRRCSRMIESFAAQVPNGDLMLLCKAIRQAILAGLRFGATVNRTECLEGLSRGLKKRNSAYFSDLFKEFVGKQVTAQEERDCLGSGELDNFVGKMEDAAKEAGEEASFLSEVILTDSEYAAFTSHTDLQETLKDGDGRPLVGGLDHDTGGPTEREGTERRSARNPATGPFPEQALVVSASTVPDLTGEATRLPKNNNGGSPADNGSTSFSAGGDRVNRRQVPCSGQGCSEQVRWRYLSKDNPNPPIMLEPLCRTCVTNCRSKGKVMLKPNKPGGPTRERPWSDVPLFAVEYQEKQARIQARGGGGGAGHHPGHSADYQRGSNPRQQGYHQANSSSSSNGPQVSLSAVKDYLKKAGVTKEMSESLVKSLQESDHG
jgi:hypothetical protein